MRPRRARITCGRCLIALLVSLLVVTPYIQPVKAESAETVVALNGKPVAHVPLEEAVKHAQEQFPSLTLPNGTVSFTYEVAAKDPDRSQPLVLAFVDESGYEVWRRADSKLRPEIEVWALAVADFVSARVGEPAFVWFIAIAEIDAEQAKTGPALQYGGRNYRFNPLAEADSGLKAVYMQPYLPVLRPPTTGGKQIGLVPLGVGRESESDSARVTVGLDEAIRRVQAAFAEFVRPDGSRAAFTYVPASSHEGKPTVLGFTDTSGYKAWAAENDWVAKGMWAIRVSDYLSAQMWEPVYVEFAVHATLAEEPVGINADHSTQQNPDGSWFLDLSLGSAGDFSSWVYENFDLRSEEMALAWKAEAAASESDLAGRPLPKGWFRVHGIVRNAATGLPIPGVKVAASDGANAATYRVTSNNDGTYRLDLPVRSTAYTLNLESPCYQQGNWKVSKSANLDLKAAPVPALPAGAPVPAGHVRVHGVLFDQYGHKIAGACVAAGPGDRGGPPPGASTSAYLTDDDGAYIIDWPQWYSLALVMNKGACEPLQQLFRFEWSPPAGSSTGEGGPFFGRRPFHGNQGLEEFSRYKIDAMKSQTEVRLNRDYMLLCEDGVTTVDDPPRSAKLIQSGGTPTTATTVCAATPGKDLGFTSVTYSRSWVATGGNVEITASPVSDQPFVVLRWWLVDRYPGTLIVDGCSATYVAPDRTGRAYQTSFVVLVAKEEDPKPSASRPGGHGGVTILVYDAKNAPGGLDCSTVPVSVSAKSGLIDSIDIQGIGRWTSLSASPVTIRDVPKGRYTMTIVKTDGKRYVRDVQVACPRTAVVVD